MQIRKKILLIILSMSFHSTIMSMKTEYDLLTQAGYITQFTQNYIKQSSLSCECNPKPMLLLGKWLTEQRNNTPETNAWHTLVQEMISLIVFDKHNSLQNKMTIVVADIVKEVAYTINPNEDCSELLIDRVEKGIAKAIKPFILFMPHTGEGL